MFGTGPRVGEALVSHPEVPLISFTGSQPTAERITQLSAPHCKKLSLELGGKNPAIIFEDANLEECIPATVQSSFANQVRVPLTRALSDGICFDTVPSPGSLMMVLLFFSASSISYSVILTPRSGLVQGQLLFVKFLVLSHTTFIEYQSWAE